MLYAVRLLLWVVGPAIVFPFSVWSQNSSSDWYEEGIVQIDSEQIEEGLASWEEAEERSRVFTDPRIGVEYIQLVAQRKIQSKYKRASELYFWGLERPSPAAAQWLEEELERLRPLVDRREFREWRRLFKDGSYSELGQQVIAFWKRLDPTLDTPYNERLMEHWHRIAYAQDEFERRSSSPYGTDDRGEIYVRLGPPDEIDKGILTLNGSAVHIVMEEVLPRTAPSSMTLQSSRNDSSDSIGRAQIEAMWSARRYYEINRMRQLTAQSARYPRYEIWIYDRLARHTNENVVFIFGSDGDTGEFGLVRSVEEMMPTSSFRTTPGGPPLPTSLMLQYSYYHDLVPVDQYFANAFYELESQVHSLASVSPRTSRQLKSMNQMRLSQLQLSAPYQRSSEGSELARIDLEVDQYRFMDQQSQPYLLSVVSSRPHRALVLDQIQRAGSINLDSYTLYHSALTVADTGATPEVYRIPAGVTLGDGDVEEMEPAQTVFKLPYVQAKTGQKFTVELHNTAAYDENEFGDDSYAEIYRGIGEVEEVQPSPLEVEEGQIGLSDVIVGYESEELGIDPESPVQFFVSGDQSIPSERDMMILFEVYNLTGKEENPALFTVNFEVERRRRGPLGWLGISGGKRDVGLTLNEETTGSYSRHELEIETSTFDPGRYTLAMEVEEAATGRTLEHEVRFQIED